MKFIGTRLISGIDFSYFWLPHATQNVTQLSSDNHAAHQSKARRLYGQYERRFPTLYTHSNNYLTL